MGVETSRSVENKRIFVVDDDEIIRAALQFMLHDENETHEIAGLPLAFAKAAEWKPDLILLAASIVRGEGVGVLSEIRERIPGVKILVVADGPKDEIAGQCLAAGAHGVLAKPPGAMPCRGRAWRARQAADDRVRSGEGRRCPRPPRRICNPAGHSQDALRTDLGLGAQKD
jgi:CheY-like chemotaxis protein